MLSVALPVVLRLRIPAPLKSHWPAPRLAVTPLPSVNPLLKVMVLLVVNVGLSALPSVTLSSVPPTRTVPLRASRVAFWTVPPSVRLPKPPCVSVPPLRLRIMPPPTVAAPPPLLSELGVRVKLSWLEVLLIAALRLILLPAINVKVVPVTPVFAIAVDTVMSLVAASVTLVVLSSPVSAVAVIRLFAPGKSSVALSRSVALTMSSPGVASPLMLAVAPTVMLVGSSSKLPCRPKGARVSTAAPKSRWRLPETSTKPPSPPLAPPRAEILP